MSDPIRPKVHSTVPVENATTRGTSRVEFLFAGVLFLALAGIVGPTLIASSKSEQAESIVTYCQQLERACFRHYVDVRSTATEFSMHDASLVPYHGLTASNGDPRWSGPYLDHAVSRADNPCGGDVFVYPNLRGGAAHPSGAFCGATSHGKTAVDHGQFVAFTNVPEDVAREVEIALDGESEGNSWRTTGRCEYDAGSMSLMVLLLELP